MRTIREIREANRIGCRVHDVITDGNGLDRGLELSNHFIVV
jgi:hypothetical protein